MKEYAVATLIFLGGSGIIAQAAPTQDVLLSNVNTASLQIEDSEIGLSVSYPGPSISGICGVEIRADNDNRHIPIKNFLDAVEIRSRFEQGLKPKDINSTTIDIDLKHLDMGFGVWFTVKTKDGSSLKEAIERTLGENRTVIALATTCK
ncbi:hypothetical protein [Pseudobdellovibrio sp. HCB154]|uniref:hypothetical protein n=1 Tax=Pseudobdellovibrio sp. HCB154 TaxID=3386277 RepID=UPI0039174A09